MFHNLIKNQRLNIYINTCIQQQKRISISFKNHLLCSTTTRFFTSKKKKKAAQDDEDNNAFISFLTSNKSWLENKLPNWSELRSPTTEYLNVDVLHAKMAEFYPHFLTQMKQLREGYEKLWCYLTMEDFRKIVEEIKTEENDPLVHPEIKKDAIVREGSELSKAEENYIKARKRVQRTAFAKFIGVDPESVDEEDIPIVGLASSGGGYRAMIGLVGYLKAMKTSGALDCLMYLTGISGSCWAMSLYYNSLTEAEPARIENHLQSHVQTHWANMSHFIALLTASPQNSKLLLQGAIQRYHQQKGDLSFVDLFGVLIGGNILTDWSRIVERYEANKKKKEKQDEKRNGMLHLSSQSFYLKEGRHPMPIYCAVRHDITSNKTSEEGVENLKSEIDEKEQQTNIYQWFEFTPYEVGCEEIEAWIPTWAFGRPFEKGRDTIKLPEQTLDILMGMFGSAFAASLIHYYQEIRNYLPPGAFAKIDESIARYEATMSTFYPISPSSFPNPFYKMKDKRRVSHAKSSDNSNNNIITRPKAIIDSKELYLMDAGMDNNIPFYPLLREERQVDVILAMDLSADIQTSTHFDRAESYIKRRGIEGWPIGIGWPDDDKKRKKEEEKYGLGTCTLFDSETTIKEEEEEMTSSSDKKSTTTTKKQNSGRSLIVAYFPFIVNKSFDPDFDPQEAYFCSTWNFVYRPDQFKKVIGLAEANWNENVDTIRQVLKRTWERKRDKRLEKK
ncbi:acyl transferase/acyl hydrolase/lysophospholipase [Cokeromyces recurvatus]|uniref:acyl transferase/acyl hydrolase/lysophospholipase n=1 Tax=Cokeromyces recurvatus TaxID=90255 RepID=UPI0022212508|nr:acyl transferase/acyl hydrolase/lysophospholipase [Cokeromyces recurvatus]KAI7903672.1 acyl transferase/acyl hydrolase/lysophospholipase [Cokeromyces recurvatus]